MINYLLKVYWYWSLCVFFQKIWYNNGLLWIFFVVVFLYISVTIKRLFLSLSQHKRCSGFNKMWPSFKAGNEKYCLGSLYSDYYIWYLGTVAKCDVCCVRVIIVFLRSTCCFWSLEFPNKYLYCFVKDDAMLIHQRAAVDSFITNLYNWSWGSWRHLATGDCCICHSFRL